MNAMQELAIKYPTLWEHIAKGGKVRLYNDGDQNTAVCVPDMIISPETTNYPFRFCLEKYSNIELIPLPKRVPTRDLGKAVNYFNGTDDWDFIGESFCNDTALLSLSMKELHGIVVLRNTPPDWWPEELMEDENND